jgi:hypothetical protein
MTQKKSSRYVDLNPRNSLQKSNVDTNFSRDQSEDFDEIMRRYSDFVESSEDDENEVDDIENGRQVSNSNLE